MKRRVEGCSHGHLLFVSEKDWIFSDIGPKMHLDQFVSNADDINHKTHQRCNP